jgi:hypothetical protein
MPFHPFLCRIEGMNTSFVTRRLLWHKSPLLSSAHRSSDCEKILCRFSFCSFCSYIRKRGTQLIELFWYYKLSTTSWTARWLQSLLPFLSLPWIDSLKWAHRYFLCFCRCRMFVGVRYGVDRRCLCSCLLFLYPLSDTASAHEVFSIFLLNSCVNIRCGDLLYKKELCQYKVLKCDAGGGWKRSVGLIMWEMEYCLESRTRECPTWNT